MRKDDLTHYRQEESSSHDQNSPTTQNATLFDNPTWEVGHFIKCQNSVTFSKGLLSLHIYFFSSCL